MNFLIKKHFSQLFSQQIHGFKTPPANIKQDFIEIYNGSLAAALKNKRTRDAKIALEKYETHKMYLFDDGDADDDDDDAEFKFTDLLSRFSVHVSSLLKYHTSKKIPLSV